MGISDLLKNLHETYQAPNFDDYLTGTASVPRPIIETTPPDTNIEKDFDQLIKSCNDVFAELIDEKKIIINANRLTSGYPVSLKITHGVPAKTSTAISYPEYVNQSGSCSTVGSTYTADITAPLHFEEDLDKLAKSIEDYNNVVQDIIVGVKRLKDEYDSKSIKLNMKVSQEALRFEVEISFNDKLKKILSTEQVWDKDGFYNTGRIRTSEDDYNNYFKRQCYT